MNGDEEEWGSSWLRSCLISSATSLTRLSAVGVGEADEDEGVARRPTEGRPVAMAIMVEEEEDEEEPCGRSWLRTDSTSSTTSLTRLSAVGVGVGDVDEGVPCGRALAP